MGITQFTEKNLSWPRGPVCCCSTAEPSPCSISIQPLGRICISIGGAPEAGSRSVPDPECRRISSAIVSAGPPMFMLICAWVRGVNPHAIANAIRRAAQPRRIGPL